MASGNKEEREKSCVLEFRTKKKKKKSAPQFIKLRMTLRSCISTSKLQLSPVLQIGTDTVEDGAKETVITIPGLQLVLKVWRYQQLIRS